MNEDWQKLEADKTGRILAEVNPFLKPVPFADAATTIRTQKVSFWRGYDLLEITDLSTVPPARKFAVYKQGDVRIIDWTNQPIYETNEAAPVFLDARTVVDYVKFFFTYVRGRHGRFLVIETIDDIRWQIEPPAQGRKIMQEMLQPVSVAGENGQGDFILDAFMVFKDSLFQTKVHVRKDGIISMSDEQLKIEGMPVLQDAA
jgi:hypothetical protein